MATIRFTGLVVFALTALLFINDVALADPVLSIDEATTNETNPLLMQHKNESLYIDSASKVSLELASAAKRLLEDLRSLAEKTVEEGGVGATWVANYKCGSKIVPVAMSSGSTIPISGYANEGVSCTLYGNLSLD